jgi:DNA-binding transcriptional MerR regulator
MNAKTCTTKQAAAKAGITRATLQAWIKDKKIKPPKPTLEGAKAKRLWTVSDLAHLRDVKKRIYRKGEGRPRKPNVMAGRASA